MTSSDPPASPPSRTTSGPWLAPLVLAGILVVYLAAAAGIAATQNVWGPDCGARLIQVLALQEHWPEWWIPYPGAALDPLGQNSPLGFYEYNHDGRKYIFYSFVYALINGALFRAFGHLGLSLLQIACGLLTAGLVYVLARRLGFRYPLAPMIGVALLTPLFHYSVVFWDPAVMTAFGAAALYLAVRAYQAGHTWLWLAVGITVGAALWFHEIILPYVPALMVGAVWLYRKRSWLPIALLLAGIAAMVAPLALINKAVYGSYAGPHLSNNELSSTGSVLQLLMTPSIWAPGAWYNLFAWGDANPGYAWQLREWLQTRPDTQREMQTSLFMGVPILIWFGYALSGLWRRPGFWVLSLLFFGVLLADGVMLLRHDALVAHSLFYVCPVLALAFAGMRAPAALASGGDADTTQRLRQAVAWITVTFILLAILIPTLGGTEWGCRFLMIPVPGLTLFAWAAVESLLPARAEGDERRRWQPGAPALLAGMGVVALMTALLQVMGYQRTLAMHRANREITQAILEMPDPAVITTVWWVAPSAAPAYVRKPILFAGDELHPAPPLIQRLAALGGQSYLLIGYSPYDISRFATANGFWPQESTIRSNRLGVYFCRYVYRPEGVAPGR